MGGQRGQAWVTCVTRSDKSLTRALVLAESLRRTKTTKRIAVIASSQVGKTEIRALHIAFDDVFCLNDNLISPFGENVCSDNALAEEVRGKIFAFSLVGYDECVFLSPDTIFLENCDNLFGNYGSRKKHFMWKSDNMFLFSPNWNVCQFLIDMYEQSRTYTKTGDWNNFIMENIHVWIKNNEFEDLWKESLNILVTQFCMKTGSALGGGSYSALPAVVQFVNAEMSDFDFEVRMKQFHCKPDNSMLLDKIIRLNWLNIYDDGVNSYKPDIKSNAIDIWKPNESFGNEPIAIVGLSCRFPGANNLEEFWDLLLEGREGVQTTPFYRWKKEQCVFGGGGKERSTRAGFLATPIDEFDAKFFGLSPKEAYFLDPQARLLHELVWEGLENSGIDPLSLRGSHAGIFTGSWMNDYKDMVQNTTGKDFFRTYMGNSMGATAARLSFMLGVTGPSIATESGCSSSIVAVDLAVKSLRNGETNLALAGGVNLLLHPFKGDIAEYVVSPDGRCKTFDTSANGFARAEGCGVLVLKRLSDAIRDRDNIWAMIRGSAVSQEGLSRSLGTPTVHCEALAMRLALKDAGVLPEQISFVEAHGTGTSVGDPMEIAAITKAYGSKRRSKPLVIGSVKTNVGHTESCSGITGIIKTVLAMHHEVIPKHLNLETINPQINLDVIPATIPLEPTPWPRMEEAPRLAGVSSFGITGTDGHVIIQDSPERGSYQICTGFERPLHIMKFSAKTAEALTKLIGLYKHYFKHTGMDISFADIAYTANTGRASFNHRAFCLANIDENFSIFLEDTKLIKGEARVSSMGKICFLFTGQGSQYSGMAKSLYDSSPVFRMHFEYCNHLLQHKYNLSIMDIIWGKASQELNRTIYSQTSIFCIEYCLLKLWESWGVQPDYVLGHSLGEFCAVVAAGIISFEDALKLVVTRSQLIDQLETGSMLVIKASLKDVERLMEDARIRMDIAAVNSSDQTVVAGDTNKIILLLDFCKMRSIKAIKLEASHAFHSRHMDPILDKYRMVAETVKASNSSSFSCQYISGVDGKLVENPGKEINAEYWIRHTRNKVSFMEACQVLKQVSCQNYLELGPHPVLSSFVMQNIELSSPINCFSSLRRNRSDWETILISLGKLYLQGYHINWERFDKPYNRKKVPSLPLYPFERKPFWVDCNDTNITLIHPLIGYYVANASPLKIFKNSLSLKSLPYLKDHCIGNRVVMPAAAFTEMCLSAGYCVANSLKDNFPLPTRPMSLKNVSIEAPLELREDKACFVQVIVELLLNHDENGSNDNSNQQQQGFCVKVFHQKNSETDANGKWVLHANSTFHLVPNTKELVVDWSFQRIALMLQEDESPLLDGFYKRISGLGLKFGESFKSVGRHWRNKAESGNDEIVVEVSVPSNHDSYIIHPIIIDAMIQTGMLTQRNGQKEALRVPVKIGELIWLGNVEATGNKDVLYLHAWWNKETGKCNILAVNENLSKPIAFLSDIELVETNMRTIESILEQQNSSQPDMWEEVWKPIDGPHSNRAELSSMEQIFSTEEFIANVESASKLGPDDYSSFKQMNKLIYFYMVSTLLKLGWCPCIGDIIVTEELCEKLHIIPMYQKLLRFYFSVFCDENLMKYNDKKKFWTVTSLPLNTIELENQVLALENELENDENMKVGLKFYKNIAKSLPQLLTGNESALQLLFPTDQKNQEYSAEIYYHRNPGKRDINAKASEILQSLLRKWRKSAGEKSVKMLRILEVGAGTGSTAENCLPKIRDNWGDNFEYYYTDISPAFFFKAEKKFEEFRKNIKFSVFDIEDSPLKQGIPLNYFDIVFAADVIHATKSLRESLANLKATLRPQGIITFFETLAQDRGITFSFGLFEHYWRFQDFDIRPNHPCIGKSKWIQIFLEAGFKYAYGTEAYFGTFGVIYGETPLSSPKNDDAKNSKIISEIKEKTGHWIVFSTHNNIVLTRNVCNILRKCNNQITFVMLESKSEKCLSKELTKLDVILGSDNKIQGIIYAIGMNDTITDQNILSRPLLHVIQKLIALNKPPRLYIFTSGVLGVNADVNPTANTSSATLLGMAKVLKNENSDMFVRYVDFDCRTTLDDGRLQEQILYELALFKESREKERLQVAYREGQRYEPRLTKSVVLGNQGSENELKLPSCCDRYQLVLPKSRMIQDLEFDILEEEAVGENLVEVKVEAYSLNFRDIVSILKPIAQFENLNSIGLDLAGVVTKVGNVSSLSHQKEESKLKVGDRIFGINFNDNSPLKNYIVLNINHVLKIPSGMTFCEAATLPTVFATSMLCLVNVAKLRSEDTVLIHTGSGGVGLSAIQVAKIIGARIITTAGNKRKRTYLREKLGIEHVFHSRDTSFEKEILKVTNGRGVDVVLNSITGPGMKESSLNVCAKGARFVEMSKLSIWAEEEVKALRPDVKYSVVDHNRVDIDWGKLLDKMQHYLNGGRIRALPYVKFDSLRIKHALQYFQKANHIGKVLVTMAKVTTKDGEWVTQVPLFNGDSTYIITGGFGGIGFEVCKWMLDKGATDIVLIGRNPPKSEMAKEIKKLQNDKKCNLQIILGDVGDIKACKSIIKNLLDSGCKPIRGIQHCAGIIRDNSYNKQTWETFEASFHPKINGTLNLHNLTRDMSLEHFVLYSSIASNVGTPFQSNYAAANCFEDAFAHYRYSLGLPATSINWGQWSQVGCAKEINIAGVSPISVQNMLNGLEMIFRTNKVQTTVVNFESYTNFITLCPMFKHYIDERLLKNDNKQSNYILPKSDQFWEEMNSVETKTEKVDVATGYLKMILRSSLRLEADEPISESAELQELGVDSLMMIEFKNSVQGLVGSRLNVTTNLVKDCRTIRDVARVLGTKIYDDDKISASSVSWTPEEYENLLINDCQLDNTIHAQSEITSKITAMKTLLITGVTGQLGPYILLLLTTKQSYQTLNKIICLIRTREGKCPKEKLKNILSSMNLSEKVDMKKVECVRGDVTLTNFGLQTKTYADLCTSVDGVVHLAVKSNHIEMYMKVENGTKDIRSVNVGGTTNILRFAATTRTKHVYYAGAIMSVLGGNNEGTLCDDWPEREQIKTIVDHNIMGYPTSKFVCEMLIKQANERGIPCKVFRFPWITGESNTGRLNYENNHFITRFFSYLKIRAMPDAPIPAIVLPVDICAELSLKLFWNDGTPNEIYNIAHPKPELEVEYMQVAQEHFGVKLELVDWRSKEFVAKLYASNMPLEALKEIYQDVDRAISVSESGAIKAIQGYLVEPENFFKNEKVEAYIPGFLNNISNSTMDIITRNLEFVKSEGQFAKYGL